MKYLIVIDSAANGHQSRSYLCRPRRGAGWLWTGQREEATEFASRKDAQEIIKAKMKIKNGVCIVPISEDPQPAAGP